VAVAASERLLMLGPRNRLGVGLCWAGVPTSARSAEVIRSAGHGVPGGLDNARLTDSADLPSRIAMSRYGSFGVPVSTTSSRALSPAMTGWTTATSRSGKLVNQGLEVLLGLELLAPFRSSGRRSILAPLVPRPARRGLCSVPRQEALTAPLALIGRAPSWS